MITNTKSTVKAAKSAGWAITEAVDPDAPYFKASAEQAHIRFGPWTTRKPLIGQVYQWRDLENAHPLANDALWLHADASAPFCSGRMQYRIATLAPRKGFWRRLFG